MLKDSYLCGSKSGLPMYFHYTTPQVKHPSIQHLLCFPKVYHNFHTVKAQTYDAQDHILLPPGSLKDTAIEEINGNAPLSRERPHHK